MAVKNNRRTQMTRLLLKTALTELMQKKAFHEITIKDICEQADLNRTTFYLHYTDQAALLRDIEDEVQQKTLEYLQNIQFSEDAPQMIEQFLLYIQEHADFFNILLCQSGSGDDFRVRFIETTLDKLQVDFPFSGTEEEYPYILCFTMQGSVHIITEWMRHGFDVPAKTIARLIFRLCAGISAQTPG